MNFSALKTDFQMFLGRQKAISKDCCGCEVFCGVRLQAMIKTRVPSLYEVYKRPLLWCSQTVQRKIEVAKGLNNKHEKEDGRRCMYRIGFKIQVSNAARGSSC